MSPTTRYNCPRSTGQLDTRTMARFMLPLLCATLFFLDCTVGFNFDLRAPVQFSGPQGSLFGFSVAQHKDGNTDWSRSKGVVPTQEEIFQRIADYRNEEKAIAIKRNKLDKHLLKWERLYKNGRTEGGNREQE